MADLLPPPAAFREAADAIWPPLMAAVIAGGLVLLALGRRAGPAAAALGVIAGLAAGNHFIDAKLGYRLTEPEGEFAPQLAVHTDDEGELQIDIPRAGYKWLPWAALLVTLHGLLARSPGVPWYVGPALRANASALAAWMFVPDIWVEEHPNLRPLVALAGVAEWEILDRLSRREPGGGLAVGLAVLFAAAGVIAAYHFATVSLWAVMLSCCWVGVAAVCWYAKADPGGALGGGAVLLHGLLLGDAENNFDSGVPKVVYLVLGLAPLALTYAGLLWWRGCRGRLFQAAQLGVILIAVVFALRLAYTGAGGPPPWGALLE